jgi:hypothetical protein
MLQQGLAALAAPLSDTGQMVAAATIKSKRRELLFLVTTKRPESTIDLS